MGGWVIRVFLQEFPFRCCILLSAQRLQAQCLLLFQLCMFITFTSLQWSCYSTVLVWMVLSFVSIVSTGGDVQLKREKLCDANLFKVLYCRQLDVFQFLEWHSTTHPRSSFSCNQLEGSFRLLNPVWEGLLNSVLERQNNLSKNVWHNTGGSTPQVKILLSTYIWRRKQQCKHLGQRRQMVWKTNGIHLCQTGTTFFEQRRWPTTLLIAHPPCSTEFPPQTA